MRLRLTDAAERGISTKGLGGIKARALAVEAGCAVGAIYNAVDDLDELILHANARTLARLEQALDAAMSASKETDQPIAQLIRLALAYLEFAAAHRRQWQALFEHRLANGGELPDWYQRDLERLFDYVERPVTALQPSTSPEQRKRLARSLFSAAHGVVALGLEEKLQFIPLKTLREQLTIVIGALGEGLARRR